jgi:hypothetical protein
MAKRSKQRDHCPSGAAAKASDLEIAHQAGSFPGRRELQGISSESCHSPQTHVCSLAVLQDTGKMKMLAQHAKALIVPLHFAGYKTVNLFTIVEGTWLERSADRCPFSGINMCPGRGPLL